MKDNHYQNNYFLHKFRYQSNNSWKYKQKQIFFETNIIDVSSTVISTHQIIIYDHFFVCEEISSFVVVEI